MIGVDRVVAASPDVRKRAERAVPASRLYYLHWLCIKVNSPALTKHPASRHIMSALSFIGEHRRVHFQAEKSCDGWDSRHFSPTMDTIKAKISLMRRINA